MELNIQGKNVLVTAGSKGIGRATAELFLKEGCNVAISSSNRENLIKAASDIKQTLGVEPFWTVCDLNKVEDINNTFDDITKVMGDIDILVNNCGGPDPGYFDELLDERWYESIEQILMSTVRMTRNFLPGMKVKGWGRIINITSIAVKQPLDYLMLSNSLRSAVTSFAKTLSSEVGKYNITINNVAPGYTLTSRLYELAVEKGKLTGTSHEQVLADLAAELPVRRLASPEEIGSMILYLASERAGFITGNTFAVDGGMIKSTY